MICVPLPPFEIVPQIAYWYIIAGLVFMSVMPFVVIALDGIKAQPYKIGGIGMFVVAFLLWPLVLGLFVKDRLS